MGLDMYLTAKRYIWNYKDADKELQSKLDNVMADELDGLDFRVQEVAVDAMYWRKANAIHNWFVENCQDDVDDCKQYWVDREKLLELIALCKDALANRGNEHNVLPTKGGFFFGSTEYDEYYYQELEETIKGLEKVLRLNTDWDFYYRASW